MKAKSLSSLLLVVASALFAVTAQAIPLLSNLSSITDGDYVGTPDSADDFSTGNTGLTISSIDILWFTGNGGISNRVGLFADSGGLPGGTQVGGWFTTRVATSPNTITYTGLAALAANTTYWMVVDILDASRVAYTFNQTIFSDPSTQGANIIGPQPGSAYGNIQTVSWNADPANLKYALNGTAASVPEPATLFLLGLGVVGFGIGRHRRKPLQAQE